MADDLEKGMPPQVNRAANLVPLYPSFDESQKFSKLLSKLRALKPALVANSPPQNGKQFL
jgi:hypothetical protein